MTADQLLALKNIDKILKLISTNRSNRKDYNIHIQDICHNMVKCITQYKKQLTNKQNTNTTSKSVDGITNTTDTQQPQHINTSITNKKKRKLAYKQYH